ncbi:MAG: glycosyltransferase family 4 protein [Nitriliruptoraceae bacterium]
MRILQLAPPWFTVPPVRYGGTELVMAALTDQLIDDGHQVTMLASGGSLTRAELRTVYSSPPSEQLGDGVVELPHVLTGYRDRHRYELIHDHTVTGAAVGALLDGPPIVHTVHGAWTSDLCRLYEMIADRVALVAVSHDHAAHAPSGLPMAGVVHNGIDVARYPFEARSLGHLAWVGRAGADKGADLAVAVATRLGLPLRIAMKLNEPEEHRWWEQVMVPLLADTDTVVVHNATHAQKLAVLRGAAALLVPIRWDEPFGLTMVEAGACGIPVVAFARGAVPEIVEDGRTGWAVPPDDVDAMCTAVERVGEIDRGLCRDHIERHFAAARMAQGYERIYASLVRTRTIRLPDLDTSSTSPMSPTSPP